MAEYRIVHSSLEKGKRTKKKHEWSVESTVCENLPVKIIYLIPNDSTKIKKIMGEDDSIITFDQVTDIIRKNIKPSEVSKCFINILEELKKSNESENKGD